MTETKKNVKARIIFVMDYIVICIGILLGMFYTCVAAGYTSHSVQGAPPPSIPQTLYIVSWWAIGFVAIYHIFRLIHIRQTKTNQVNERTH